MLQCCNTAMLPDIPYVRQNCADMMTLSEIADCPASEGATLMSGWGQIEENYCLVSPLLCNLT